MPTLSILFGIVIRMYYDGQRFSICLFGVPPPARLDGSPNLMRSCRLRVYFRASLNLETGGNSVDLVEHRACAYGTDGQKCRHLTTDSLLLLGPPASVAAVGWNSLDLIAQKVHVRV